VSGIKMVPVLNQVDNTFFETKSVIKTMSVEMNNIQKILGHCVETYLKAIANAYGVKVFGKLAACESCAISNANQKKTNKVWNGTSNVPGERSYVDISSIKDESVGGAKFWDFIVDDCTD
jgi:hypothetical protein